MARERTTLKLVEDAESPDFNYRRYEGELWTAQQRQMHSLHYTVSYRASFKPELPDFCIQRYSNPGDIVLDPFSGRGTTALQANLLGRVAWACDVNPLAVRLTQAKVNPAGLDEIVLRLNEVDFRRPVSLVGYQEHFAPFYDPDTYRELVNLRSHIAKHRDRVTNFIELIAVSRLHGHSPGFFSVYSFPQISIPSASQRQINAKRGQTPEYRAIAPRIIRKAAQALRDGFASDFYATANSNLIQIADARRLQFVPSSAVDLIVTSPPFLDKVDYLADNWLEFWFAGIDPRPFQANVVMHRSLTEWSEFVGQFLKEMLRVLKWGAYAVIEVGEVDVNGETINLDEIVAQTALQIRVPNKRFVVHEVLVNKQNFTKLANCFNVENNLKGTNTNRLVVLRCASSRTPTRKAKQPA